MTVRRLQGRQTLLRLLLYLESLFLLASLLLCQRGLTDLIQEDFQIAQDVIEYFL